MQRSHRQDACLLAPSDWLTPSCLILLLIYCILILLGMASSCGIPQGPCCMRECRGEP